MASLANWVHHVQYILPQGRTVWENPNPKKEEEEGDGEGEEEEEEDEKNGGEVEVEVEPENGPGILSPITADEGIYKQKNNCVIIRIRRLAILDNPTMHQYRTNKILPSMYKIQQMAWSNTCFLQ